jgi:UPF0716 family protein affecting phage T7 exclusion
MDVVESLGWIWLVVLLFMSTLATVLMIRATDRELEIVTRGSREDPFE